MIRPQELRIGNLVEYEKTTHVITGIGQSKISSRWIEQPKDEPDYECHFSEISEIPLTEEWLVKMGVKISTGWNEKGDELLFIKTDYFEVHCTYIYLEYVHRLQNLVFLLADRELEIKP